MNATRRYSWMWAEACALLEAPTDIFTDGTEVRVIVALPGARAGNVTVQIAPKGTDEYR